MKVEISHRTIIFTVLLLLSLWGVFLIRDVLFLLFLSFVVMAGLRPIVDKLESWRIPRFIAILLLYIVIIGVFVGGVAGFIPTFITQLTKLILAIPNFLTKMIPSLSIDYQALSAQIAPVGENIVKVTVNVFSNFITVLTVLTFSFYFLLARKNMYEMLTGVLGDVVGEKVFTVMQRVEQRLGAWLLGELLLMVVIGTLVYIGLLFLHVEFALPLAILAGLLEIVPTIGPIVSSVPAILVGFSHSPVLALSVAALYIIVQQFENNIIVPIVMKQSVGIPPVLTILALMIGARMAGTVGAIFAVPVLILIQEVIHALPNVTALGQQRQPSQKKA